MGCGHLHPAETRLKTPDMTMGGRPVRKYRAGKPVTWRPGFIGFFNRISLWVLTSQRGYLTKIHPIAYQKIRHDFRIVLLK